MNARWHWAAVPLIPLLSAWIVGWQVEKTTKSGDTVEYKAIKGTAAVEIEISSAGARERRSW